MVEKIVWSKKGQANFWKLLDYVTKRRFVFKNFAKVITPCKVAENYVCSFEIMSPVACELNNVVLMGRMW